MQKINNNNLGDFYIENLENREESDRVKLYDSDCKYLDYLPIEIQEDETEAEIYNGYLSMLESFTNICELMDWLVCDCEFIGSKEDAIKHLHEELNWDLPNKDYNPLNNEWVNRIGDTYVVISEY